MNDRLTENTSICQCHQVSRFFFVFFFCCCCCCFFNDSYIRLRMVRKVSSVQARTTITNFLLYLNLNKQLDLSHANYKVTKTLKLTWYKIIAEINDTGFVEFCSPARGRNSYLSQTEIIFVTLNCTRLKDKVSMGVPRRFFCFNFFICLSVGHCACDIVSLYCLFLILFSFGTFGKAVLRDCCLSWVTSFIF